MDFGNEIRVNIHRLRKAILGAGSGCKEMLLKWSSFAVSTGSVQADVVSLRRDREERKRIVFGVRIRPNSVP